MKNVVWLSLRSETPARGYWDQYLFELAFKDYNHSLEITDQKRSDCNNSGSISSIFN